MSYDELEEARRRFESTRLDFIATELDLAVTFGQLALGARSPILFERFVRKACLAYHGARRFLVGIPLSGEVEERIGLSVNRLEWIFRKLGEREDQISQGSFGAEGLPLTPQVAAQDTCKPLSRREEQVVRLVAGGRCNKEIAKELGLSTRTVETYRLRLMRKLELHGVSEVVKFAIQNNLSK
jgi:DNA-binding CsgD family transcriptional regulator